MKTWLWVAGFALALSSTAWAAAFRIDDLAPEQGCKCDCFTGLSRATAKEDADGRKPLLAAFYDEGADIRINGISLRLNATDQMTPSGWIIFEEAQSQTVLKLHLRDEGLDENGDKLYRGKIEVTYKGSPQSLSVTGFHVCN